MPAPLRHVGRLRADLAYTTVEEVLAIGLHEYIDDLQTRLNQIGEAIFQTFVQHSEISQLPEDAPVESTASGAYHAHADEDLQVQQQQQQQ